MGHVSEIPSCSAPGDGFAPLALPFSHEFQFWSSSLLGEIWDSFVSNLFYISQQDFSEEDGVFFYILS